MKQNPWTGLISVLLLLILLLYTLCFTVQAGTAAVIKTFGAITDVKKEPGFYFKWPWPIQSVVALDTRIRVLTVPGKETPTRDQKNILLTVAIGWRIVDPIKFLSRLASEEDAKNKLADRVADARMRTIQTIALQDLLTIHPEQAQRFDAFQKSMQEAIALGLREADYGIEIESLRIQSLAFPRSTTEKIFARMIEERKRQSEWLINKGKKEAGLIRNQAELERENLLTEARAQATILRGQGDAAAAESFKVFKENPELANFLREMDALRAAFKKNTTIVLPAERPLQHLLEAPPVPKLQEP